MQAHNSDMLYFDSFWSWLMQDCRDFVRLGEQLKTDGVDPCAEDLEVELEQSSDLEPTSDVPPPDCCRIGPGKDSFSGIITTAKGSQVPFSKHLAEATWHRYHGLRQAALRLQKNYGIQLPLRMGHRMASSYAKPGSTIYDQNWIDCPQPFRAPAFVAAAIHVYCKSQLHLGLGLP